MLKVEVLHIQSLTHDVKQFRVEKPSGYSFVPGQATEVAIDQDGWREEKRPFTFTSLPDDDYLEFVIKSYKDHDGVTNHVDHLKKGDRFLIDEPWGAIEFKGKGVFIAGGAGITPFISILKAQKVKDELKGNQLIFANKTSRDVILEDWFRQELGGDFISILDQEEADGHEHGRVEKGLLQENIKDFNQKFYICGPEPMIESVKTSLEGLGADLEEIVFEK